MRLLAGLIGAPIYPTAEHALRVGVAVTASALKDETSKRRLLDHLTRHHLLVRAIGKEHHDLDLVAGHPEVMPGHEELAEQLLQIIHDFEENGIPLQAGIDVLRHIQKKLETEQSKRNVLRKVDLGVLRDLNAEFPNMIPSLIELMGHYSKEELAEALSPPEQDARNPKWPSPGQRLPRRNPGPRR